MYPYYVSLRGIHITGHQSGYRKSNKYECVIRKRVPSQVWNVKRCHEKHLLRRGPLSDTGR
jgi:hypothetical protein